MLPVIRAAVFWIEFLARCAYRAVVCTSEWPSNPPIVVRLSASARAPLCQ